jgi:hypothetical protein
MKHLLRDLLSAIVSLSKSLIKEPGFAFWGALALALGIGANAVIYCSSVAASRRYLSREIDSPVSLALSQRDCAEAGQAAQGAGGAQQAFESGDGCDLRAAVEARLRQARRARLKDIRNLITAPLGDAIIPLKSR